MTQYKVIAGQCPLPDQRVILDCGDVRDEDFFIDGQIEDLVRRGFIAKVVEAEPVAEVLEVAAETAEPAPKKSK